MQGKRGWVIVLVAVGVVMLGVLGLVIAGGFGAATWLADRGGGGDDERHRGPTEIVAVGDAAALRLEGAGISEPFAVCRVDRAGSVLRDGWRWEAPAGLAAHPWEWMRVDDYVVGELHPVQGATTHRLAIFHIDDGFLGEVQGVDGGEWSLGDGALLAVEGRALVEHQLSETLAERWRVPLEGESPFVPRVGMDDAYAYVYDGTLRIVDRSTGTLVRELPTTVVGVDPTRGEVLSLRDGRLEVTDIATGTVRTAFNPAGETPLVDGMWDPQLLGIHAQHWLIYYSTELDRSFSVNNAAWSAPGTRWLAAVDPDTTEVVWRSELGSLNLFRPLWPSTLPIAKELATPLLLHGDADVEGGQTVLGHLISMSLTDGVIAWRAQYEGATRSNALFTTLGSVSYLRVRERGEGLRTALARFDDGRFTGAVFEDPTAAVVREPAILEAAVWVPGPEGTWSLASGPSLAVTAGTATPPPTDARAFALERLVLPRAAR